jgi:hypothetical protein
MHTATESSHSYDFYDSDQARRARKKLGEAAAYKVVNNIYLEAWPQIESATAKLKAEGGREMVSDSMFYEAFKYACDDIADASIHELSPEDIANQARRALQIGLVDRI